MGTTWAGYSPYSHRFAYSESVENAQKEAKATKSVALYRAFGTITPSTSYAQALKNNSTVPVVDKVVNYNSKTNEKYFKNSLHRKEPSSTVIRITDDITPLTVAGVPAKYGKCVPSKYSVPSTHNSLHRKEPSSTVIRITDDSTPLTVAGVPAKYGKCVPSQYSVPSTHNT